MAFVIHCFVLLLDSFTRNSDLLAGALIFPYFHVRQVESPEFGVRLLRDQKQEAQLVLG